MLHVEPRNHNVITKSAAVKLLAKIEASAVPIAVFASSGSWKATKTNSELFLDCMSKRHMRSQLMGIYTSEVLLKDLEDDLSLMGVK